MLNSFASLKCSKKCYHNVQKRRNKLSGAVTLEVFPMGKSLGLGSPWVLITFMPVVV